jgi:hypothetical protein
MNASTWLNSKLNLLRNSAPASQPITTEDRSTRERLDATLRQQDGDEGHHDHAPTNT